MYLDEEEPRTIELYVKLKNSGKMPNDLVEHAKKTLSDFAERDRLQIELDTVKNDLESFAYKLRNRLEEKDTIDHSTQQERDNLSSLLNKVVEWLENEVPTMHGKPAVVADFEKVKQRLVDEGNKIWYRIEEAQKLNAAIGLCWKEIEFARNIVNNHAHLGSTYEARSLLYLCDGVETQIKGDLKRHNDIMAMNQDNDPFLVSSSVTNYCGIVKEKSIEFLRNRNLNEEELRDDL